MRQSWTDDRLDDLNSKVDAFRLETRSEFSAVRGEMKEGFDRVDGNEQFVELRRDIRQINASIQQINASIQQVNSNMHQINSDMTAFQTTIVRLVGGLAISLLISLLGLAIGHI